MKASNHKSQITNRGFTLIEMLVSTAIFAVVMVIALGALLAMSESDRKAQTLKTVINNLNFSVDSMSRAMRTGTDYLCGGADICNDSTGRSEFSFIDSDGRSVSYCLSSGIGVSCATPAAVVCPAGSSCSILRSINGEPYAPLTSPEVKITHLSFFLVGAVPADNIQPKATILLSGYVQVTAAQQSVFNIQTSVTQRVYDQ